MKIMFFRESEKTNINPDIVDKEGFGATDVTLCYLAKYLSKSHDVKIYCPTLEKKFYSNVEYIPYKDFGDFIDKKDKLNPDFVIVTGNPSIISKKFIFGKEVIFWQKNHPDEMKNFQIKKMLDEDLLSKIVFSSDYASDYAKKVYENNNKIIGIYNGIRDVFYEDKKVKKRTNKIIYVGSFVRNKGLLQFLEVANKLKYKYEFEACGSFDMYGTIDEKFKKECIEYFKEENIEYAGKSLGSYELSEKMQEAQLAIVNPIIGNKETCCVSGLEAMASGLPVIGGGKSLLDSIITQGSGVTFTEDLSIKIEELMSDKEKINALQKKGKEFVEKLRWEKIILQWEELFEKIMS